MERFIYTSVIASLLMLSPVHCYITDVSFHVNNTECCLTVPKSVEKCYASSQHHPISSKSANVDCLQRLLWFTKHTQKLSNQDKQYFSLLSKNNLKNGEPHPKTGFRIRKEYRRYTDAERSRLHKAFQNLYKKGVFRKYAELHKLAVNTTHNSVAFLAWHRVFLAMFEDELRLEDNTVSLPYWDTTLDEVMDNPVNSIVWSSKFFGNANGDVVTGPFAGWRTARGNLWRNYGSNQRGRLISENSINKILTRCKTGDIVFGANYEQVKDYVIEYHSNGAHNWVGGDMSDMHFAAYDPVFYMLHAFVDMIWEKFRLRQKTICGVNPETDYPATSTSSGVMLNDLMEGFDGMKYIDGLKNYWTNSWYNYEETPICPDCGSKYLFCNSIHGNCVSHSRRRHYNPGLYITPLLFEIMGFPAEPFEPQTELIPKHIFRTFLPAPLRDIRTKESAKHDAKTAISHLGIPAEHTQLLPQHHRKNTLSPYLPALQSDRSMKASHPPNAKKATGHLGLPAKQSQPVAPIDLLNTFLPAPAKPQSTKKSPHTTNGTVQNKKTIGTKKQGSHTQSDTVPLNNKSHNRRTNAIPQTNGNNNINANNIGTLLNVYINMLQHNLPGFFNQGPSNTKNNKTSSSKGKSKAFLTDKMKTIDLQPRLQKHKTQSQINTNLSTNTLTGLNNIHHTPLIDLVAMLSHNLSPQRTPTTGRRKFLTFI